VHSAIRDYNITTSTHQNSKVCVFTVKEARTKDVRIGLKETKITTGNNWIPFNLVVLKKHLSNIVYVPESIEKGIQVGLHLHIQRYVNY
jgi:hypothetical protein